MLRLGGVSGSTDDDQDTDGEEEEEEADEDDDHHVRAVLASLPAVAGLQHSSGVIGRVHIADSSNVTVATHVINVYNQVGPVGPDDARAGGVFAAPSLSFKAGGASARTSPLSQKNCSQSNQNVGPGNESPVPRKDADSKVCGACAAKLCRWLSETWLQNRGITVAVLCVVLATVSVTIIIFTRPERDEAYEQKFTISPFNTTSKSPSSDIQTSGPTSLPPPTTSRPDETCEQHGSSSATSVVYPAQLGYRILSGESETLLAQRELSRSETGWLPLYFGLCADTKYGACSVLSVLKLKNSSASLCASYTSSGFSITQSDNLGLYCWTVELQAPIADRLCFRVSSAYNGSFVVRLSGRDDLVMSMSTFRQRQNNILRIASESGPLCFEVAELPYGDQLTIGRSVSVGFKLPSRIPNMAALYIGMCQPCGGTCSVLRLYVNGTQVMQEILQSLTSTYLKSGDIVRKAQPTGFQFKGGSVINAFQIQLCSARLMEVTFRSSNTTLCVPLLPGQNVVRVDSSSEGDIMKP